MWKILIRKEGETDEDWISFNKQAGETKKDAIKTMNKTKKRPGYEYVVSGFDETVPKKEPRKKRSLNQLTKLREYALEIDPSVKSKDINRQEDFIYVCMKQGIDNKYCLSLLRKSGVKRLSRNAKYLLTDEYSWEDFVELHDVPELYPIGNVEKFELHRMGVQNIWK